MNSRIAFRIALSVAAVLAVIAVALGTVIVVRKASTPPHENPPAVAEVASKADTTPASTAKPAKPPKPPKGKSLYEAGRALLRGDGVAADPTVAVAFLIAAADSGPDIGEAAYELGEAYRKGAFGLKADPDEARSYLAQATNAGHLPAAITLGRVLIAGDGVEADPKLGIALLEAQLAIPRNAGGAAYELGRFYLKGTDGFEADPGKARNYLQAAVDAKHGRAAVLLGRSLLRGQDMPADPEAGAAILRNEVDHGKEASAAAFELGSFYLKGSDAAPPEPVIAGDYLARAIDAGHPDAAYTLGRALLRGEGMPVDVAAGVELLALHASKSKKPGPAAMLLGQFYLKGSAEAPADPAKARVYLDQAVKAGEKDAPLTLARALLKGEGLPEDPEAAIAILESQIAGDKDVAAAAYELGQYFLRVSRAEGSPAEAQGDSDPSGELDGDVDVYGFPLRSFSSAAVEASASESQAQARAYLERASAAGHKDAAVVLGRALIRGDGLTQDITGGSRLLQQQSESGPNPGAAAFELGAYLLEKGTPEEIANARAWLQRATDAGYSRAATTLGRWLLKQEDAGDRADGLALLEGQIEAGKDVSTATYALGAFYLSGEAANPKKAQSFLEAAVAAGNKDALLALGRALLSGKGVGKDPAAAAPLLQRAIDEGKGVAAAAMDLGTLYLKGANGVPANPAKAKRYLEIAAEAGDKRASTTLGRAILRGELPGSASAAVAMLRLQIADGRDVATAAFELGQFYLKGGDGIAADAAKANRYLEQAGVAGRKDASLSLGKSLLKSDKPGDRDAGAALLDQAAANDPASAASLYLAIGKAYLGAEPSDPRRARIYLERAAAAGSADAWVELGRAAADGKFGQNGGQAAIAYYQRAIAAGASSAYTRLARIYIDGKGGVRKDVRSGMDVLRQASNAGNADAMRELMAIYLTGIKRQVNKDIGEARRIFQQYQRVASAADVKVQALLIEAADGGGLFQGRDAAFRRVMAMFVDVPKERRAYAAQQLFRINRDAAIYLTQSLLKSAGLFAGNANGVYAPDTIDAIQKACRAGGEGQCGPKTLHGDTIGFIARNYS